MSSLRIEHLREVVKQEATDTGSQLIRDLQQMLEMAEKGSCDMTKHAVAATERMIRFTESVTALNHHTNTLF